MISDFKVPQKLAKKLLLGGFSTLEFWIVFDVVNVTHVVDFYDAIAVLIDFLEGF